MGAACIYKKSSIPAKGYTMKHVLNLFLALCFLFTPVAQAAEQRGSKEQAIALVKKAKAHLNKHGKEKSIPVFSDTAGPFRDRDLFLVMMDLHGKVLSHAAMNKMIGTDISPMKDANGVLMVQDMLDKAKTRDKGWSVEYLFFNPGNNRIEPKITYFEKVGDVILFCGIYYSKK